MSIPTPPITRSRALVYDSPTSEREQQPRRGSTRQPLRQPSQRPSQRPSSGHTFERTAQRVLAGAARWVINYIVVPFVMFTVAVFLIAFLARTTDNELVHRISVIASSYWLTLVHYIEVIIPDWMTWTVPEDWLPN